jgi:hypothetical protein
LICSCIMSIMVHPLEELFLREGLMLKLPECKLNSVRLFCL